MTKERVIEALDACREHVLGFKPGATPTRCNTSLQGKNLPYRYRAEHMLYMVDETKKLVHENRQEKAMRWLGFIQGAMWGTGFISIDELKKMNMPKEEGGT